MSWFYFDWYDYRRDFVLFLDPCGGFVPCGGWDHWEPCGGDGGFEPCGGWDRWEPCGGGFEPCNFDGAECIITKTVDKTKSTDNILFISKFLNLEFSNIT